MAAAGAGAAQAGTAAVPGDGAAVARYYGGTVSFGRVAGQPRRAAREVVVNVASADPATGQVAGTLSAAGLGNVAFAGQLGADDTFALTTTGDVAGTLTGRLARGGTRMSGVLAADDGSSLRVTARALTAVGGARTADGSADVPNFTGSTTGTVTLRQRADALAVPAGGATSAASTTPLATIVARQNLDLTLDITTQNADRTLTGTLTAGSLGTYDVAGIATGNQLTLLVTPRVAAGGTDADGDGAADPVAPAGVLRLTAAGNNSRFVGRFEQATGGVFGVGRINLARVATGTAVGVGTAFNTATGTAVGTTVGGTTVGGTVNADGSVLLADGNLLRPDGTVIAPDGTVLRVGTGTGGNLGTAGAIGTAPGATGASAANSPIGVIGTAPGSAGATTANSLVGPIGTAPGATGAGVTDGTVFGLGPITPGSTGAFSGLGATSGLGAFGSTGTFGNAGTFGTAIGSPIYAAGGTAFGRPAYTYSPVGSPAYLGSPFAGSLGGIGTGSLFDPVGRNGAAGFDVVGSTAPTSGTDGLMSAQLGGAYGTAFNDTGSIFAS